MTAAVPDVRIDVEGAERLGRAIMAAGLDLRRTGRRVVEPGAVLVPIDPTALLGIGGGDLAWLAAELDRTADDLVEVGAGIIDHGRWVAAIDQVDEQIDEWREESVAAAVGWVPAMVHRLVAPIATGYRLATDPVEAVTSLVVDGTPYPPTTGDPGGFGTTRVVGPLGPALGRTAADRGRDTAAGLLGLTTGRDGPWDDEYLVVDHGDDRFTVVLPGVVDLTRPLVGLDPRHRSVRDLDRSAFAAVAADDPDANPYAAAVAATLAGAGVPPGAELAVVGHSYGADAAIDLLGSSALTDQGYRLTTVVAAGYHVDDDRLASLDGSSTVLVLENRRDLPVLVESVPEILAGAGSAAGRRGAADGIVVRHFDGGLAGAGHDPSNYARYLRSTADTDVARVLSGLDRGGFTTGGTAWAVDVSVPDRGSAR